MASFSKVIDLEIMSGIVLNLIPETKEIDLSIRRRTSTYRTLSICDSVIWALSQILASDLDKRQHVNQHETDTFNQEFLFMYFL